MDLQRPLPRSHWPRWSKPVFALPPTPTPNRIIIKYGTLTALGTHLRYSPEYHSVAADWSRFPLGTKFRMKGHDRLFVVDDYGKALVGGATIDIYFPTKERMNNWGLRWVDIEVVEFGNFHESRKILAARATYPHCREMLATMTNDNWWKDYK